MSSSSSAVAERAVERASTAALDGRFLTPRMRAVLAAAAERILPRDEWPGAGEAHVIGYIDWLVEQPSFAGRRSLLPRGVELLDSLACTLFGRAFVDCPPEQQDAVLGRVQSIPHRTMQRFFATLVRMTLAGYFGDPVHGGNRDGIVWTHMGRAFESTVDLPGGSPSWPRHCTTS